MVEQRDVEIILNNPIDWEQFRNKTVLVTGATGRLGMYIVEAISKADIDWNLNVTIIALARNKKKLEEVFGTGTAAVISPVGELRYKDDVITINDFKIGELTQKLYDTLTGIQWGKLEDKYGWTVEVK